MILVCLCRWSGKIASPTHDNQAWFVASSWEPVPNRALWILACRVGLSQCIAHLGGVSARTPTCLITERLLHRGWIVWSSPRNMGSASHRHRGPTVEAHDDNQHREGRCGPQDATLKPTIQPIKKRCSPGCASRNGRQHQPAARHRGRGQAAYPR